MRAGWMAGCAVAAALLLAGCGDTEMNRDASLLRNTVNALTASRASPQPLSVTRAQIESLPIPVLFARLEKSGAESTVGLHAENRGVVTWTSPDALSVIARDGIILATRGFAGDLMSSSAPDAARVAAGTGTHARSMFFLGDLDRTVRLDLTCELARKGAETITILDRNHPTQVVEETCSAETAFTNRYWIEGKGRIRQSRQWLGESVGFLRLSDPS